MSAPAPRADIYSHVTAKIMADLERGVRPWLKPWNAEHAAGRITRPLRFNGQPYKGINVLMLWGEAELKSYACPIWMTFRQSQELGGHVRKDEHGSLVVYADKITRSETDESGEESLRQIPFMKGYTVFNCEQIEGLPPHFYATTTPPKSDMERIAGADSFAANTGATIRPRHHPPAFAGRLLRQFPHAGDATARLAEDIDEALELGRAMAAEKTAEQSTTEKPPRRRWRRKRMTPKVRRRRFILGHNRRIR
jgi:antirestriction protein ArdC